MNFIFLFYRLKNYINRDVVFLNNTLLIVINKKEIRPKHSLKFSRM